MRGNISPAFLRIALLELRRTITALSGRVNGGGKYEQGEKDENEKAHKKTFVRGIGYILRKCPFHL